MTVNEFKACMTVNEFKAWFEGYTEGITKLPTQKQWARIKERMQEMSGDDHYVCIYNDYQRPYPYRPWWPAGIQWTYTSTNVPATNIYANTCTALNTCSGVDGKISESDLRPETFPLVIAANIGRDEYQIDVGAS